MTLYIGNIHFDMREPDILEVLSEFGAAENIRIPVDYDTGHPRGFCFADMSEAHGRRAIDALDRRQVWGRIIRCNEAKPPRTRREKEEVTNAR